MEADPGELFVEYESRRDHFLGEVEGADAVLLKLLEVNAVLEQQVDRVLVEFLAVDIEVEVELPCRNW